jgi:hypothetical protein
LVEPACGAALAVIYSQLYDFSSLLVVPTKTGQQEQRQQRQRRPVVVVEICGGNGVNLELLQGWQKEYLS